MTTTYEAYTCRRCNVCNEWIPSRTPKSSEGLDHVKEFHPESIDHDGQALGFPYMYWNDKPVKI